MYPLTAGLVISTRELWDAAQEALRDLPVRVVLEQPEIHDWPSFLDKLQRLHPEVLLLDLSQLREPVDEVLGKIKGCPGAPVVIALHTSAEPETILAAVRAGAHEYLYPPLGPGLHKALERISGEKDNQQAGGRSGGKVLAFFSAKGGCGATTLACHLATELQRMTTHEILLADFDLDAGLVGFLMKAKSPYSILDAVVNIHRLDLSYWKALISNGHPHLEIITAPSAPAPKEPVEPDHFRHVLRFARMHYDWSIVDLGRSLNALSMSLLDEIDQAFLVTTLELPAMHQAKQILQNLRDGGYGRNRVHLVLNRMPKRADFTPEEVEKILGVRVHAVLPNDYQELYESCAAGKLAPATSAFGKQITRLAQIITGVQEGKSKRKFTLFG